MNLLLSTPDDPKPWQDAVAKYIPEARLYTLGRDDVDFDAVDYALVWMPEPGLLAKLPNLKAVFNLGAGVDKLLADDTLPRNVPVVRLVDPRLAQGMCEYIVHWVLHFHRDMHVYAKQQRAHTWVQHENADPALRRIGILGFGELGRDAAHALRAMGFTALSGWSRTRRDADGVDSFAGEDTLDAFLAGTDVLINLLPDTPATRGLVSAERLAQLPEGAFVINAGRGTTVVEADLMAALETGHVAAAALDVFAEEPLPREHPFWDMDNVFITPHVASLTTPDSATRVIKAGLDALEDGRLPENVVNMDRGY